VEATAVEFSPSVTLLVGTNGSGKSSILDALAVMISPLVTELGGDGRAFSHADVRQIPRDLNSRHSQATSEPQYPLLGVTTATLGGRDLIWARHLGGPRGRTTAGGADLRKHMRDLRDRASEVPQHPHEAVVLPVFAYYGVERTASSRRAQGAIAASRSGAYASALDPRPDLTRLATFLEALDGQVLSAQAYGDAVPNAALGQFRAIEQACDEILKPVGWGRLRWNRGIGAITMTHPDQGELPLTSLSSGVKITAGLALDLASRMARANPYLGHETLLRETPGVVLIDEVDLHLHPTWQKVIVPQLRRTFPRIQFILTSHSPHVIATVDSADIRILDGSEVSVPHHAYGLRPEKVLEFVQGTSATPQTEIGEELERYLDNVYAGRGRTPESLRLRSHIEEVMGGIDTVPELINADAHLAFNDLFD
jgi:predicted ATP-binding protein involved in virulence